MVSVYATSGIENASTGLSCKGYPPEALKRAFTGEILGGATRSCRRKAPGAPPEGLTAFRAVHCYLSKPGDYGLVSHGLKPIILPRTFQLLAAPRLAIRS